MGAQADIADEPDQIQAKWVEIVVPVGRKAPDPGGEEIGDPDYSSFGLPGGRSGIK